MSVGEVEADVMWRMIRWSMGGSCCALEVLEELLLLEISHILEWMMAQAAIDGWSASAPESAESRRRRYGARAQDVRRYVRACMLRWCARGETEQTSRTTA